MRKRKSSIIVGVLAVIVCAILTLLIVCWLGKGKSDEDTYFDREPLIFVYDEESDTTKVYYNGVQLADTFKGSCGDGSYRAASVDGSVYAFLTDKESLYIADEQGLTLASENTKGFALSYNGNGLAYCNENGEVILYDCIKKAGQTIDEEISAVSLAISPDGKTVTYTQLSDEKYTAYCHVDGKKKAIAEGITVFSVSDNASGFFGYDEEGHLYYLTNVGEKEELSSNFNGDSSDFKCCLNIKNDEIVFSEGKRILYYSAVGSKEVIFDSEKHAEGVYAFCNIIFPDNAIDVYNFGSYVNLCVPVNSLRNGSIYFMKYYREENNSLAEPLEDGELWFIGKKGGAVGMSPIGFSEFALEYDCCFKDGVLFYDGYLYSGDRRKELDLGAGVPEYGCLIANKGKDVYYLKEGSNGYELYYSDIDGKNPILINDGISKECNFSLYKDEYLICEEEDSVLIFDSNGEKKKVGDGIGYMFNYKGRYNRAGRCVSVYYGREYNKLRNFNGCYNTYRYMNAFLYVDGEKYANENDLYLVNEEGEMQLLGNTELLVIR